MRIWKTSFSVNWYCLFKNQELGDQFFQPQHAETTFRNQSKNILYVLSLLDDLRIYLGYIFKIICWKYLGYVFSKYLGFCKPLAILIAPSPPTLTLFCIKLEGKSQVGNLSKFIKDLLLSHDF